MGWGAVAPLSGWVVQSFGVKASILIYFCIVVATTIPTLLLPINQLGKSTRGSQHAEAPAMALRRGITEPLLSSRQPDERAHGGKAAELAIELGEQMALAEAGAVMLRPVQVSFGWVLSFGWVWLRIRQVGVAKNPGRLRDSTVRSRRLC